MRPTRAGHVDPGSYRKPTALRPCSRWRRRCRALPPTQLPTPPFVLLPSSFVTRPSPSFSLPWVSSFLFPSLPVNDSRVLGSSSVCQALEPCRAVSSNLPGWQARDLFPVTNYTNDRPVVGKEQTNITRLSRSSVHRSIHPAPGRSALNLACTH